MQYSLHVMRWMETSRPTAELRLSTRQINGGSYHRAAGLRLVARLLAKRKRTHGTASKSKPARVMTYVLFW